MQTYDKYKDSGVEWAGDIPFSWNRFRIKFALSNSNAGVWGDDEKGDENDIACFRVADFDYIHGCLRFDKLTYRNIEKKQLENRELHRGDLLIEKSGGGDATPVGRVVRFNFEDRATCSNFVNFVSMRDNYDSNFFYYYFNAIYSNKENMLYFNQTTGIQNLKIGEYLGQLIYLPSYQEQQSISSYLDKKCADIDKVIATQQRRIELLQELKQSTITHAVTHGLNPNVKMKDSGVEWFGEMPKHWEITKVSNVCNVVTDFVASGSFADLAKNVTYLDEPDYAMLIRTADLSQKNKSISKVYINKASYDFLSNSNLFGGEIVLPNIGASIGDVYMIEKKMYEKMSLAPNSIMLKTKYHDKFYYYLFKSKPGRESLQLIGQASAQGKFNKTDLRKLRVLIPPITEQIEIVKAIEKALKPLDASISKAQKEIDLLQEYKEALISEVVTGKRKVC